MASKCEQKFESTQVIYVDNSGPPRHPMNAFLIFCKRQRGCVRRKYPFLENCEVTRVLGEWWAALGTADKSLYSVLANQHKENLIRNHPEVKWFKPKMPGGTKLKIIPEVNQPGIVPGKLADESQLGGLSSLLQREKEVIKEEKPPLPKPLKKRYRDEIYQFEQQKPVVSPMVEEKEAEKTEIVKVPSETNESEEERLKIWRSHILEENNNQKQSRDRACKGQRYREFMWTNYSNRRRANRWELNQDKHEVIPIKKPKTVETEVTKKTPKISDSDEKAESSISSDIDTNISKQKKKKKTTKNIKNKNAQTKSHSENNATGISNVNSEMKANAHKGCDESSLPLRSESDSDDANNSSNSCSSKDEKKGGGTIIGSRKRKIRKRVIRRLEPGSIFNGVGVIADNDLPKL